MSYKLVIGDIFDKKFCNSQTCVIQQCNCIALKPHGLSKDIVTKFGAYADVYGLRKGKTENIANIEYRDKPGTIKFCHGSPNVVALFGQFMFGNVRSRTLWKNRLFGKIDTHLDDGINHDTQPNRLIYFQKALVSLNDYLLTHNKLKICTIVFPYKIGCGLAGGIWDDYQKEIEKFSKRFISTNTNELEVFVVYNPDFQK